jgi:aspartyl-tRNA(Asn)/glutamyl-tRNA(Gln) amidotransferase subunit A
MAPFATAAEVAAAVRAGRASAVEITREALRRVGALDGLINAFTGVFEDEALAQAGEIDRARAEGRPLGPLAGVPFAVKNLFDVAGHVTLAGAKVRLGGPAAARDAALVTRLRQAGAVLIGALNMDEFAYGFVTENAHFGPTRNPHDLARIAGGSSGGSAAAVAAGLAPLTLGSDTNGSIRIPAALCGVFGLKPTLGRLPVDGVFPFVRTLDHAGMFARTVEDLALGYDAGLDEDGGRIGPRWAALAETPLRVGILGGWFRRGLSAQVLAALARVEIALGAAPDVILDGAEAARSAAFCLTAYEGGRLHLADLAERLDDYDPAVGGRLLAGALTPEAVYRAALAFRTRFAETVLEAFQTFDVLIAPTTLGPAPPIGQETMRLDGADISIRKNLGLHTQPISFVGVPVIAAPIPGGALPVGVQIIAAPGREDLAFAAALQLERRGLAVSPPPLDVFTAVSDLTPGSLIHAHQ